MEWRRMKPCGRAQAKRQTAPRSMRVRIPPFPALQSAFTDGGVRGVGHGSLSARGIRWWLVGITSLPEYP